MREKIRVMVRELSVADGRAVELIHAFMSEDWESVREADNEELAHALVVLEKITASCRK